MLAIVELAGGFPAYERGAPRGDRQQPKNAAVAYSPHNDFPLLGPVDLFNAVSATSGYFNHTKRMDNDPRS